MIDDKSVIIEILVIGVIGICSIILDFLCKITAFSGLGFGLVIFFRYMFSKFGDSN